MKTKCNTIDNEPEETTFNQWFSGKLTGLGSFDCALFDAYIKASSNNKEKLKKAFSDLFTAK